MNNTVRNRATMLSGTQDILNARSLENAHRRLAELLQPGMRVIDQAIAATRPGGLVLILDYNRERIRWEPEPPEEFTRFYQAFLRCRPMQAQRSAPVHVRVPCRGKLFRKLI